jgi:hypothetical protein
MLGSCVLGQETQQPLGRLARLGGGSDDRAVVLTQHFQPRADVVRVPDDVIGANYSLS